jgi:hypothetical protein
MVASAAAGDTVLVRAGTYFEKIDFLGKDVVLKSLDGPQATIIDASGNFASVVYMFEVGEGARLEGFTLTGGSGTGDPPPARAGGGVFVKDSRDRGPIIENNWVIHNTAIYGGGISVRGSARVLRNRIASNEAGFDGGGVETHAWEGSAFPRVIVENEIFDNRATGGTPPFYNGGGANLHGNSEGVFSRNIVACNVASGAAGLSVQPSPAGRTIEGNVVFANSGLSGVGGVHVADFLGHPLAFVATGGNAIVYNFGGGINCNVVGGGAGVIECNDIYGNTPVNVLDDDCGPIIGENDNFSLNPLFGSVDCPPTESYHFCLLPESPLLPENSPPGCGLIGARGACPWVGIAEVEPAPGADSKLLPAEPNPFAERTAMPIDLPGEADVRVDIVNARGGAVVELTPGRLSAGQHRIVWDGHDARGRRWPPGVYFARIHAGDREFRSRLLLLR